MAKAGKPARIVAKFNSLEDRDIIKLLYKASQAGVKIDLVIRGFCCLMPGVKGQSENIRVISIVGRFLEHSRIFYFQQGSEDPVDGQFYIGSADWMRRNLHGRVEVITPVKDRALKRKLLEILEVALSDKISAWEQKKEGTYSKVKKGKIPVGSQQQLMQLTHIRSQSHPSDESS